MWREVATYMCVHAQLCLTNEEMRKELVRNALAWLRKHEPALFDRIAGWCAAWP